MSIGMELHDHLYKCLKDQEELLDRLIEAGEAQFNALKGNNLEGLQETVQEQEFLAAEMEKMEKQRLSLQTSLEERLRMDRGAALSKLLLFAAEPVKTSLEQACIALKKKMADLAEINTFNAVLIKKAMLVNSSLLQILNAGVSATYGGKGEIKGKAQPRFVLNRRV